MYTSISRQSSESQSFSTVMKHPSMDFHGNMIVNQLKIKSLALNFDEIQRSGITDLVSDNLYREQNGSLKVELKI